jgi:hypothetical protein
MRASFLARQVMRGLQGRRSSSSPAGVARTAKARCPEAARTPTAAEHHKVAAVFSLQALKPSRRITPPPTPETTQPHP